MELTYNELKKRDVINIADGRCLGRITDIKLRFPQGVLVGIFVPGRKRRGIFACFDKSEMFIEESKILKIGGTLFWLIFGAKTLTINRTTTSTQIVANLVRPTTKIYVQVATAVLVTSSLGRRFLNGCPTKTTEKNEQ